MRLLPLAALSLILSHGFVDVAFGQTPPLVFTSPPSPPTSPGTPPQLTPIVEERGLALWSGSSTDFGIGVSQGDGQWTLRAITGMTTRQIAGRDRPAFEQIDVTRPVLTRGSLSIAAGGGLRREWDDTHIYLGRVTVASETGVGRLQGSVVVERAVSASSAHDAADVVTTVGWSRPVGRRISVGFEGIGQDLEGLWNAAEADGGAKLFLGPTVHARSPTGRWEASLTGGPVVQTFSSVPLPGASASSNSGRHFGIFASATWIPFQGR